MKVACKRILFGMVVLATVSTAAFSRPEVTVLQNGVSPTPEYRGCKDTWISNEKWETNRNQGRSQTLRCGGQRRILIQFDLSAVPKGHVVYHALLRLAEVGYPRKERGEWATYFQCWRLARAWNDNANWLEHTRTDYKQEDAGDWEAPGGDIDLEPDFGKEKRGLVASAGLVEGPWGHLHELDVTELVKYWHTGQLANHGLLLAGAAKGKYSTIASSEWYIPGSRPCLLISHGPTGSEPADIQPLGGAPEDLGLDPLASSPDVAIAKEDYAPVCVGQNSNCALRGTSTDAYIKVALEKYPGAWGWMTACRVGGRAGDFSSALLCFDLSGIPKNTSVRKATLRLTLTPYTNREAGNYRYGAFMLKLPDAPGWNPEHVNARERKPGVPWPEDGLRAVSGGGPVAIGKLQTKRERNRTIPVAMEFDLTGAVRAWVQEEVPNCGIVLDNRIEGGAYDFYASRAEDPELRPYLEIVLSPAIEKKPGPVTPVPELPEGDYWVKPMREVHSRFKGKPGTLAQYGDSITVTMAFLAGYSWTKEIAPKNCAPQVKKEMDAVTRYANRQLWRDWKEAEWGNTGMMMSDWLLANIDTWQKKMNPETAVIMFGTNDVGRIYPPEYTENMAAAIRRMLQDGTVPILTIIPPRAGRDDMVPHYRRALLSIAREFKIPVIDFYMEILRRRPDDWNGRMEKFSQYKGYDVPTLMSRDGVHPSAPKQYRDDWSEEGLRCSGYDLRNYLTLRKYYEVITRAYQPSPG